MRAPTATDIAIDALVLAACDAAASPRETHLLRESLLSLVRLAQAELLLPIADDSAVVPRCPRSEW